MIRFLVLAGYFELTIYLHLSGKLNQYINMHYSYLAYISMVLSFILAIVQLYIWMKQVKIHSHLNSRLTKVTSVALLAIPIVVGLTFPTVSLVLRPFLPKDITSPYQRHGSSHSDK